MSYSYPQQNAGYAPQGANPGYGSRPEMNQSVGGAYQSLSAFPAQGNPHHAENGQAKVDFNFDDRSIRAAFVRKVFSLITVMLAVVAVMTAIPMIHKDTYLFITQNRGIYWLSYGTFFIVYLVLMCCENVRRSFPSNIICTGILTLAIGFMTATITASHKIESVLLCLVITTICCGSIIVFSMQTKHDLTSMMGYVFIASMVLMAFGFVAIIAAMAFKVSALFMVYAGLAALLFMVYLAIDVQMIMGGKKYEISPEDHIFAAIQVFLDIIYIFWMLLSLLGSSNN